MCQESESVSNSAASQPKDSNSLKAADERGEGANHVLTRKHGDRHPHEPPALIEDGSFIVECDEDIIADGLGGVYDPVTGARRKKHRRRLPTGTQERNIACVIVERGDICLPDEVSLTDPVYKLLVAFGRYGVRIKYPHGGCRVNIYWNDHACDSDHDESVSKIES